jgi:TPR repeat protein
MLTNLLSKQKEKRKIGITYIAAWHFAALNGHIRSQFYVGVCFDNGYGVDKDIKTAYNWYLKSR